MNRSDDVYLPFAGVSIKQKVPLRVYIGLEKNNTRTITFGKIQYREATTEAFVENNTFEYAPYFYEMNEMLNKMYEDVVHMHGWVTINILSELPRSRGLWFEAIVSMTISFLMHRLLHHIDRQKLEKINHLQANEILNNTHIWLDEILGDSFAIDLEIFWRTFFSKKISTLLSGWYPVVSFSEGNYAFKIVGIDLKFKRFAFRLDELFPELREVPYSPVDYWLFYTGKPVLLEQVFDHNLTNIGIYKSIQEDLIPRFQQHVEHLLPINKPEFYSNILTVPIEELNRLYGKIMGMVSLEVLYFMKKLYTDWYTDIDMKSFIKAIDKIRYGDYISRETSQSLVLLINKFLAAFDENRNVIAIYPNDMGIMGWSLWFVMPIEWFRTTFYDSMEKIDEEFSGTELIYANRIDGLEYEWLKIEQDIDVWVFSPLLGDNMFMLTDLDGKRMVWAYDQLIKKITTWLLFDSIHGKIYFDWVKLTSNDIHSQSATIEIVSVLMAHLGEDISNASLPLSRYSKNKNDMIGKIVIPLLDFIEKKTGKHLPLICKWSLYDFYMKLDTSNISIYSLRKI